MKPHTAKLQWIAPQCEAQIIHCARVSSDPDVAKRPDADLMRYLIKHKHFSPLEMGNMCLEISTTRDIARQILRHRSFSFQEFSQRYADVSILGDAVLREARMQHPTNRQMSIECEDRITQVVWGSQVKAVWDAAYENYKAALDGGISKEVARSLLPEGLTPSRMFMNGTIRSWVHFLQVRLDETAQKEVRMVAASVAEVLKEHCPVVYEAVI